jgi:hypothetical protein
MRVDIFIFVLGLLTVVLCTTGFFLGQRVGEMHCIKPLVTSKYMRDTNDIRGDRQPARPDGYVL